MGSGEPVTHTLCLIHNILQRNKRKDYPHELPLLRATNCIQVSNIVPDRGIRDTIIKLRNGGHSIHTSSDPFIDLKTELKKSYCGNSIFSYNDRNIYIYIRIKITFVCLPRTYLTFIHPLITPARRIWIGKKFER